jgi:hypothetical protein
MKQPVTFKKFYDPYTKTYSSQLSNLSPEDFTEVEQALRKVGISFQAPGGK